MAVNRPKGRHGARAHSPLVLVSYRADQRVVVGLHRRRRRRTTDDVPPATASQVAQRFVAQPRGIRRERGDGVDLTASVDASARPMFRTGPSRGFGTQAAPGYQECVAADPASAQFRKTVG